MSWFAGGCKESGLEKPYPLSPHDLAAYDRLAELVAAGVSALKIEGRLKPAEYVASVTRHYRAALDEVAGERLHKLDAEDIAEMEAAFSRGFCHGWLDGRIIRHWFRARVRPSGARTWAKCGACAASESPWSWPARCDAAMAWPSRGTAARRRNKEAAFTRCFRNRRSVPDAIAGGVVELAFRYVLSTAKKLTRARKFEGPIISDV